MKRDETPASTTHVPSSNSPTSSVLLSLADTTWRMFIPTIGLLLLGRYFDNRFDTKPWLMFLGIIIGSALAWILVRKQLRDIAQEDKQR